MRRRAITLAALGVIAACLAGCSTIKPWEHDIVARPGMQVDPDPLMTGADEHIYFSREASKGGEGFGGGGCGCN